LETSNYRLERDVAALDSLLRLQLEENTRLKADLSATLGSVDERLRMLEGRVEDSGYRFSEIVRKMDKGELSQADSTGLPDSLKIRVSLDPQKLYDQAYLDFAKGSYDLAIQGFSDYLKYFPQSLSADKARYWVGECYFAKEDYNRSLDEFQKLLQDFPSSDKIPGTLYKIGLSYEKLKNQIKANRYFGEVINKYPNSAEAELAKDKLGIGDKKEKKR